MTKRIFFIVSLVFFLLLPFQSLASVQLPELESHYLLNSIQQGIIKNWIDITASGEFSEPEKQGVLFLIRNAIQKKELDYAFKDLPRQGLEKMARLAIFLYFAPDAGQILDKVEKESVKKAGYRFSTRYSWGLVYEKDFNNLKISRLGIETHDTPALFRAKLAFPEILRY